MSAYRRWCAAAPRAVCGTSIVVSSFALLFLVVKVCRLSSPPAGTRLGLALPALKVARGGDANPWRGWRGAPNGAWRCLGAPGHWLWQRSPAPTPPIHRRSRTHIPYVHVTTTRYTTPCGRCVRPEELAPTDGVQSCRRKRLGDNGTWRLVPGHPCLRESAPPRSVPSTASNA